MSTLVKIENPLEQYENYADVNRNTILSTDLVVLPLVTDEKGCQLLQITDLNFGELTTSHMHTKVK
jgi:hypothetical protein